MCSAKQLLLAPFTLAGFGLLCMHAHHWVFQDLRKHFSLPSLQLVKHQGHRQKICLGGLANMCENFVGVQYNKKFGGLKIATEIWGGLYVPQIGGCQLLEKIMSRTVTFKCRSRAVAIMLGWRVGDSGLVSIPSTVACSG